MERPNISVSMPILWVRPSIQVIHQTAKNSILTSEEIECLINYFSGLYSSGGSVSTRDSLIFLLQNLVFLINLKKSILHPTQKIPYLRIRIKSVEMTIALPQEKKIRFYISVSLYWRGQQLLNGVHQIYWLISINNNSSYSSTTAISGNAAAANYGVKHESGESLSEEVTAGLNCWV